MLSLRQQLKVLKVSSGAGRQLESQHGTRADTGRYHDFKAGLIYVVSSRPVKATHSETL